MRLARTLAVALTAAVLCCALSACGALASPTPSSTPSTTGAAEPLPSASATPTPSVTPTAAVDELVVSSGGLGPIRMGSRVTADAPVRWNPAACAASDLPEGRPFAGIWQPTIPLRGPAILDRDTPFGILTVDGTKTGTVSLLQVWSPQFSTPSGLRVGSTEAEVRAALPAASRHLEEAVHWYTVTAGPWRITLTVGNLEGQPVSDSDRVALITVYPSTIDDNPWWGTDVGAHCGI